jgi:hypothetical protein
MKRASPKKKRAVRSEAAAAKEYLMALPIGVADGLVAKLVKTRIQTLEKGGR